MELILRNLTIQEKAKKDYLGLLHFKADEINWEVLKNKRGIIVGSYENSYYPIKQAPYSIKLYEHNLCHSKEKI